MTKSLIKNVTFNVDIYMHIGATVEVNEKIYVSNITIKILFQALSLRNISVYYVSFFAGYI